MSERVIEFCHRKISDTRGKAKTFRIKCEFIAHSATFTQQTRICSMRARYNGRCRSEVRHIMQKPNSRKSRRTAKVVLRIKILMAEQDIASVVALHKKLIDAGVDISYSQLARVVADAGKRLNVDLLEGLATIFNCQVRDLFAE